MIPKYILWIYTYIEYFLWFQSFQRRRKGECVLWAKFRWEQNGWFFCRNIITWGTKNRRSGTTLILYRKAATYESKARRLLVSLQDFTPLINIYDFHTRFINKNTFCCLYCKNFSNIFLLLQNHWPNVNFVNLVTCVNRI